jgi:hypothetical protein
VFQTRTSTSAFWTIEGARINTLGDVKDPCTIAAPAGSHCKAPDVACTLADGQYVVAWAQGSLDDPCPLASHQVIAQKVDGQGLPVGAPLAVSAAATDQPANVGVPAPAVAAGPCGTVLIVWEGQTAAGSSTTYSIPGSYGSWACPCAAADSNGV